MFLLALDRWFAPEVEPVEPTVLDCTVQVEACESRLPLWFPSPVARLPDAMAEPATVRQRAAMGDRTPAELDAVRRGLFRDLERRQAYRHEAWRSLERAWTSYQSKKWLVVFSWLVYPPMLFFVRRRRNHTLVATVHRHRVELGDDVVYFADLAEGDASRICQSFVGDREGDYAGLREAVLARIPAGRRTREVAPEHQGQLEGLRR